MDLQQLATILSMDFQQLATILTADYRGGGLLRELPRETAKRCIGGLVEIAVEYKRRHTEHCETKIAFEPIEKSLGWMADSVDECLRQLTNINSDLRMLFQQMAVSFDVALGTETWISPSGEALDSERPNFSQELLDSWTASRAPNWLGIPSKTTNAVGKCIGFDAINPENNETVVLARFSTFLRLALKDLHVLKMARAKQSVSTITPPLDQTTWLVRKVAECVSGIGGKRAHILPIAQAIAQWADPSSSPGDQWGKNALKNWRPVV